ncbi:hypothetical protein C8J48_3514 [Desmospora activa DSM 45169]|uniref:Peptidase MA-like domain-containing protein n=2 Tax=Desmospora TaxID=500614 RepID=A0A2T4Z0F4_9BACL|nr:hypothetical protein C8J48_3514 [Desmospora activa DSM 45169]
MVFLLLVTAVMIPAATAADQGVSAVTAASRLIQQKQEAVNRKDRAAFLAVLNPADPIYIKEQSRWFEDAVRWIEPGSYRLRLISAIPAGEHQLRAWVEQSYCKDGSRHRVRFPLLLQETETGLKDSDYPFYHLTHDDVLVRFTDESQREQAVIIQEAAIKALAEFRRQLGWKPEGRVEIKIYREPEVFRHSVKLSLPRWAGGWFESGQSIKLVGADSYPDRRLLSSTVIHELTHRMVSEQSGDNAAYWLQEGAAEYYQSHLVPGLRQKRERESNRPRWTLRQLEGIDLESLPSDDAADYYRQCEQLFRFMRERFGQTTMQRLWISLELYPTIDRDGADKLKILNKRTREALKKVTGYRLEQLEREWLDWMKKEKSD